MRIIGKIKEYNGQFGIILDENNQEYTFLKDDILVEKLNVDDLVTFDIDIKEIDDFGKLYFARFIKIKS